MAMRDNADRRRDIIAGLDASQMDEETLWTETQKYYPYADREASYTSTKYLLSEEAANFNPLVVLLGDDVSESLFEWLTFGMNSTNEFNTPAIY
jgi:hypothetical protein